MKKGFVHLLLLFLILTVAAIVAYVLISAGIIKNPLAQKPSKEISTNSKQTINLKSEYKNPFAKDTHYVNPFSDYKNPIDNIK